MNTQTGAVDCRDCPLYPGKCKCGKCMYCGYHKHTAIHGTVNDGVAGSKPFGHEFVEGTAGQRPCPTCGRKF